MIRKSVVISFISLVTITMGKPFFYNTREAPYGYNYAYQQPIQAYAQGISAYSSLVPTYSNELIEDRVAAAYIATPNFLPTLNVLAEVPYSIGKQFTVVPMLLMSKENMNMVSNGEIIKVSKEKPVMTIKNGNDSPIQCTPAVRIVLEKPISVYSLKTSVLFPSEVLITHRGYKIPIRVGAVIAPVTKNTYVSLETPVAVRVVYAVPTRPINIDYINNEDAIFLPETEAVVVESENLYPSPPRNITLLEFPETEAEPVLHIDEENEELVNRNPPQVLAPAGIVQSTQPVAIIEPFHNSKESAVLISLREKDRL